MPFDFGNFRLYDIDYNRFYDELNAAKVFSDKALQMEYLNRWIKVLKHHDGILKKQFNTQAAITEYVIKVQSEPEVFQLPIHFKSNNIFINFRVSIIKDIINKDFSQSQMLPISDFVGNTACFYWTKVERIVEHADSMEPIIAVPHLSGQYNYLVIDGNHRLTYKTKHNIEGVPTLIVSEESVIELKLCSSSFDEMYYIFNNEICRFANGTLQGNCDNEKIFENSYLKKIDSLH